MKEATIEKKHLILAVLQLRGLALERCNARGATDEVRQTGYWQAANAIEEAMKAIANKKRTIKFVEDV